MMQRALRYFVTGRPRRDDRPPLPAGHALTWGALIAGTVLEGTPYPFPVWEWA